MRRGVKVGALCIAVVACSAFAAAASAGGSAAAQLRRVGAAPWRRAGHQCQYVLRQLMVGCTALSTGSEPTEFVQVNAWPPRTLASRGWSFVDSVRVRDVADSVRRALDARGAAGVPCGRTETGARVLADEEWRFGGQRVRLWAAYDTLLARPPVWRVDVFGYASTGPACAEPGEGRRLLTATELGAVAREWLYERLGW